MRMKLFFVLALLLGIGICFSFVWQFEIDLMFATPALARNEYTGPSESEKSFAALFAVVVPNIFVRFLRHERNDPQYRYLDVDPESDRPLYRVRISTRDVRVFAAKLFRHTSYIQNSAFLKVFEHPNHSASACARCQGPSVLANQEASTNDKNVKLNRGLQPWRA